MKNPWHYIRTPKPKPKPRDILFIDKCYNMGFIKSPCLVIGATAKRYAEFLASQEIESVFSDAIRPASTVIMTDTLEKSPEPAKILDEVFEMLPLNGACITFAPVIAGLSPNFYDRYAKDNGLTLRTDCFIYLSHGLVDKYLDEVGDYCPPPSGDRRKLFPDNLVIAALIKKALPS